MEFLIGEKVPNLKTPNSFEITVDSEWSEGCSSMTLGPFVKDQDENILADLVLTFDRMLAHENFAYGVDKFNDVKGFLAWFRMGEKLSEEKFDAIPRENPDIESYEEYAETYDLVKPFRKRWLSDPYEMDDLNGILSYQISYFDEHLLEYTVVVSS